MPTQPASKKVIPAKLCYAHVGGRLGGLLTEIYIARGWIKQSELNERVHYVTPKGKKFFSELGVDLSLIPEEMMEL